MRGYNVVALTLTGRARFQCLVLVKCVAYMPELILLSLLNKTLSRFEFLMDSLSVLGSMPGLVEWCVK